MADWAAGRREAAQAHHDALNRAQELRSAQARELIAAFMIRVRESGVPAERLLARNLNGRGSVPTRLRGWYVRANGAAAVGEDGQFYLLLADGGLRARLFGATLHPSDPPLILGESGRDGESIPLREALARIVPE